MKSRRFLSVVSCLIACLIVPASLARGAEPKPVIKTAADLQKRLDMHIAQLSFDGVGLSDGVQFVRDVSGVNIFVDWNSLGAVGVSHDTAITAKLKNVALRKVVRIILDSAQGNTPLDFAVQDNILVISTADALKSRPPLRAAAETAENEAVQKKLDAPFSLHFQGVNLKDSLEALSSVAKVKFDIDWDAIKADGVELDSQTLDLAAVKAPARALLSLVLLDASAGHQPLDFVIRDGVVHITTQAKLDKR